MSLLNLALLLLLPVDSLKCNDVTHRPNDSQISILHETLMNVFSLKFAKIITKNKLKINVTL